MRVYKIHSRPWKGIKGHRKYLPLLPHYRTWVLTLRYQNCWHNGRQFLIVQLAFSWQRVKKMRHKPTERHTFSVRTVTDNKYHVFWHIRKKKPSTLQFPHQKDCGWVLRFKSDLCFPTWLFVFCLITAFILYQIFLSEGFSGCQQLGSSASSQTMPEFRSEPRIPASRLGKRWDCYGGDSSPSISGRQPPSVSFTTPPLVPSSQFGLQLGSLLTKY